MVNLLARIRRGQTLQPASHRLLLGWMQGCKTGAKRLRGDLPAGTVFAHRTGTTDTTAGVTTCTNDVGILALPGGGGHVAIAAFLRSARGAMEERERVLASIGRAVYERYAGA
jgi:beta-lactamase class A